MKCEVYYHYYDKYGFSTWVAEEDLFDSITYDTKYNLDKGNLSIDECLEEMHELTRFKFDKGAPSITLIAMGMHTKALTRCMSERSKDRKLQKLFTTVEEYYRAEADAFQDYGLISADFVKHVLSHGVNSVFNTDPTPRKW